MLSYSDSFVSFTIRNQITELIESNSEYYNHIMNERVYDKTTFSDILDGAMYQDFRNNLPEDEKHQYATLMFNTDGAPLYKSSSYSIWPIYLQVNEFPFNILTNELIVSGLWFGKNKPDMTVFFYVHLLKPVVNCLKKEFNVK